MNSVLHKYGLAVSIFALLTFVSFSARCMVDAESKESYAEADSILEKIEYIPPTDFLSPGDESTMKAMAAMGLTDVTAFFGHFAEEAHLAHVLASPGLSRFVMVRYDYKLKDNSLMGHVIKLPENHFLVNTRTQTGRAVALYFEGFSQAAINEIILPFKQSRPAPFSTTAAVLRLLVEKSCAANWTPLGVARVVITHPEPFVTTINSWAAATTMKAVSSCAGPVIDTVSSLLKMNFNWSALNPFTSPTGKIFNLCKTMFAMGRDLIQTVVTEVETVVRQGRMSGSRAIYLACAIIGGVVLKPLQALLRSRLAALELSERLVGRAMAGGDAGGLSAMVKTSQQISWKIEDAKELIATTFAKIPGSGYVNAFNDSKTAANISQQADAIVRTQRVFKGSQSAH